MFEILSARFLRQELTISDISINLDIWKTNKPSWRLAPSPNKLGSRPSGYWCSTSPMDWPLAISLDCLKCRRTRCPPIFPCWREPILSCPNDRAARSSIARTSRRFRPSPSSSYKTAAADVRRFAHPFSKASRPVVLLHERRKKLVSDRVYNVLFLCTGNSARSILAESILRKDGNGRFRAFSAGSQPKGDVHPIALCVLESMNYPTDGLRSKTWEEFAVPDAPVMDFVFTVCDNAAGESCPIWPGQPMTAHWGIEDPAAIEGSDIQRETAFVSAFRFMKNRIAAFTALPLGSIDAMALGTKLRDIGNSEGSTSGRPRVA